MFEVITGQGSQEPTGIVWVGSVRVTETHFKIGYELQTSHLGIRDLGIGESPFKLKVIRVTALKLVYQKCSFLKQVSEINFWIPIELSLFFCSK